ncbi:maleylpyruvate isomerase family mycothiol-dependent enzyme [Nonomuraea sp. NPDC050556]|uniref:maleylpyruvate isomerase family mycothiol-dependent enzyme n=1 Tax=Nonomuraea sp. NPDC050556 TaxID=3364369 RepID=UPI0037AF800C
MTDPLERFDEEATRFVALITGADLTTPVPTCPGWTLADLVTHLGQVHRWAEHTVRTHATSRPSFREAAPEPPPGTDLPGWLASGIEPLKATLRAADPDAPVWAWGADQHVRFWPRRMWHETLIHRTDVEQALGLSVTIPEDAAVDGIDEFLANLPHARNIAPRLADLTTDGQTLHLHATDTDGEWLVTMPPAYSWTRGHTKADVAVRGPVAELLLMVYGRRPPETLTTFGDPTLLTTWLNATAL